MISSKPTVAFFGATGGSACACLALALKAGHHCTALVRTPSKLDNLLTTQYNVSRSSINELLTIYQGDAKDHVDVSSSLINPSSPSHFVDIIYTSIGTYPIFQASIGRPFPLPAKDATICEDGMAAQFAAIDRLSIRSHISTTVNGKKPLIVVISSTASGDVWKALPWSWITAPLYIWLLGAPHDDKLAMEKLLHADRGAHVRDFVVVRPAILTDGPVRGVGKVRVGWEWGLERERKRAAPGPVAGWSIGRNDLGLWLYEKVVKEGGGEWEGKCVSLSY
ncbi:hypothetical protein CC86DRAFT_410004 [Ophiobolus disseminans]|uniref:NAD(P)-binding domain-containing protein n=1 Tax=Ophiobolus disseminans TaxID=1469910 RepID=A0A6A6ZMS7_9PLEO|nr:hypothetical protein CC86DRAFT_410004 [Ophiobolus disseminans]